MVRCGLRRDRVGYPVPFAASSVRFARTDDHLSLCAFGGGRVLGRSEVALREARRSVADGTDRDHCLDFVGDSHQRRHGAEGIALVVHVQPADDDPATGFPMATNELDDFGAEELPFIDNDHLGVVGDERIHLGNRADCESAQACATVARESRRVVALIDRVLEGDDLLSGEDCEVAAANCFIAFPAEHRSDDELQPSDEIGAEAKKFHEYPWVTAAF